MTGAVRVRRRQRIFTAALIGAGLLFVAAELPLPLFLIAPGSAIDLSSAVVVGDRSAPRDRFLLTDVQLIRASPLRLIFALLPGVTLAQSQTVIPRGSSGRAFATGMASAMAQSQAIAAVVAERAAGLPVPLPAATVNVGQIDAASLARGVLAVGDVIRGVGGSRVRSDADVRALLLRLRPGASVRVTIERAGRPRTVVVRTVSIQGRTRFGLILTERYARARLVVPVHYALGKVGGSSGGLMLALRIYDSLRAPSTHTPRRAARTFAGTGTLALDGRVGPIEGTRQKLIAAKRAGARVFFVPRANLADIAGEREVRVVPVDTFGDALREVDG